MEYGHSNPPCHGQIDNGKIFTSAIGNAASPILWEIGKKKLSLQKKLKIRKT